MSTKELSEQEARLLSEDLEACLEAYSVSTDSDRPKMYKGLDVGLIVVSTLGLGLMVFIAVIVSMMVSLPV